MVTDALLALAGWVASFFDQLLPDGNLTPPSAGGIVSAVAKLDSLLPVSGLVGVAVGVLGVVVAFVLIRITLTLWNLIWP